MKLETCHESEAQIMLGMVANMNWRGRKPVRDWELPIRSIGKHPQPGLHHYRGTIYSSLPKTVPVYVLPCILSNLAFVPDFSFSYQVFFLLINLLFAALGLCCCTWAFSHCGKHGLLFVALCVGFSSCGAQAPGTTASLVAAHGLSCTTACGIFPHQGSNPCSLHWQADS